MAQSGMPVPADRAEMPVFDAVLADIGDYQSIEQNLSTFSAHVTNIDFISRTATANSLVLLDELGSATDPEEGAALAVAIAEHFRKVGCMIVISTHHTSLKVYGANTPGVINASVGFDETTLQPTYELKIGVPGASAGINIAQRLGLNPAIIASARSRLGSQTQDVARFLDRLHADLRELEAERSRMKAREQELEREKSQLATEGRKEQQAKIREMETKLEALFRDFEYHARETVNAVQDRAAAQKLSKDAERRIAKMRREFREQFDATVVAHATGADRGDPNAQPSLVKHVSEGDTVKLKSMGRAAVVKKKIGDNHFDVEIGSMKMRIAREDIAEVLSARGTLAAQPRPSKPPAPAESPSSCKTNPAPSTRPPKSTSSAAPWTKPPAKSKNSWTAPFSPECRECASSTAAAWASCAKPCASICRSIRTWSPSPNPRSTRAAAERRWWSYGCRRIGRSDHRVIGRSRTT